MKTKEKDHKYFGRGSAAIDLDISRAQGSSIWDINGKEYIDFLGGSGVGILGWAHEETELAIRNSERPSYVHPSFYYRPWADLAELLATITPKHLTKSFRTTGGSEAVDAAMQIAMMYTGRKKFLSLEGSYHGNTLGTLSISASSNHDKFHNLLPGCEKIKPPLDSQALGKIEAQLKGNEVAAFIMEPVVTNLGVMIPGNGFMEKLDLICKEHGTLLVMDEAICGFGRTGKLFGTEHFNIKPDIMCLAKGISGGHAGLGAVITTDKIADAVEGKIGLYSSYGWHPISVDAAIVSIRYLIEHTEELFDNVGLIGGIFKKQLSGINFRNQAEIRIKGLAIAVDLGDKEYASEIKKQCFEQGLLINTEGSSLAFFPALNIERQLVEKGLGILKEVCETS